MKQFMKRTAAGSLLLTGLFCMLCRKTDSGLMLSLAITAGTVAYHFTMRLCVGTLLDRLLHNRVDYTMPWFRVGQSEMNLYKYLKIRLWKNRMPTYDPSAFDPAAHTWDELAQAMYQPDPDSADAAQEKWLTFWFTCCKLKVQFTTCKPKEESLWMK